MGDEKFDHNWTGSNFTQLMDFRLLVLTCAFLRSYILGLMPG
jgi:hypothetical protein